MARARFRRLPATTSPPRKALPDGGMTIHQRILAVQSSQLEPGARFVVLTIAMALDEARPGDGTTIALDDLVERTGQSRSTVNAHLARLVEQGVISRERRRGWTITRIDFAVLAAVAEAPTRRGGARPQAREAEGEVVGMSEHRTSEHRTPDVRTSDAGRPNIGHQTSEHRTSNVRTSDPIRLCPSPSVSGSVSPHPNPSPRGEGLAAEEEEDEAARRLLHAGLLAYLGTVRLDERLRGLLSGGDDRTLQRVRADLKARRSWPQGTRLADLRAAVRACLPAVSSAPEAEAASKPSGARDEDLGDDAPFLAELLVAALEHAAVHVSAGVSRALDRPRATGAAAMPPSFRAAIEAHTSARSAT